MIKVAVMGAGGKMGREVVKAVAGAPDMELVGACDIAFAGSDVARVTGVQGVSLEMKPDLESMIADTVA